MKLRGVLVLIGVACLVPAGANAATARGIVVGKQHGLLLVAAANGSVTAVRGHAAIGARLRGSTVVGHATRARIHGVVVKRVGTRTLVSSNRHLLVVHTARTTASAAASAPGTVVNETVEVKENGELEEQDEDDVGHVDGAVPVQATITAVGAGTVTLSVSGQSFTVELPAGLTLPAALVGQTVTLNVSVGRDDDDQGEDDDNQGPGGGDDD